MYTDLMNNSIDPADSESVEPQSKARQINVKKPPVTIITKAQMAQAVAERELQQGVANLDSSSVQHHENAGIQPYFSVQDLVVGYDDTIVVNGLSLNLQQGEIGCFLGYSGCGKTTALRAIAGLEESRGGKITLNSQRLTEQAARVSFAVAPAKRGMGMVFQDYALFGHLSVAKNIAFGHNKWSAADKKARVAEMLRWWNCLNMPINVQASSQVDSSRGWHWLVHWHRSQSCCYSMSRFQTWMWYCVNH
jgi:iron(III) transport system ATP-binding protein